MFTPEVFSSQLARRPYDLPHAAISTWLNGGVPSTDVADWAGHSVAVLHEIYAKYLDRRPHASREQIDVELGPIRGSWDVGLSRRTNRKRTAEDRR